MFRKEKLYEIVWKSLVIYTTLVAAKNEVQAIKKFYREHAILVPSIISFKEYKIETQNETLNGGN